MSLITWVVFAILYVSSYNNMVGGTGNGTSSGVYKIRQKLIEKVVQYNYGIQVRCVAMVMGQTEAPADWPRLQVTGQYLRSHRKQFDKTFFEMAECILAFVDNKTSLKVTMEILNKVDFGLIVLHEAFYPNKIEKYDRHILKLAEGGSRIFMELFCPKEDKSLKPTVIKSIVAISDLITLKSCSFKCPSYVADQDLSFTYVPGGSGSKIVNGKIVDGGYLPKMYGYLAEKFKFNPIFKPGSSAYITRNRSWIGGNYHVQQGTYFMGSARLAYTFHVSFEMMTPHHSTYINFVSKSPKPSESPYTQILPLSKLTWGLLIMTLFIFGLCFLLTHKVYTNSLLKHEKLHKYEDSKAVFLVYTIEKVTEHDPIPWFTNKWSSGKLLTMLWTLFGLIIVLFYNSNLRAHLSALEYNNRIDSLQDVLDNGGKPWIMLEIISMRKEYVEQRGLSGTPLHKVTIMAEEMGGYYKISDYGAIPLAAIEDVVENNAVVLMGKRTLRQLRTIPVYREAMKGDILYRAKEKIEELQISLMLRKHSPFRQELNLAVMVSSEFGLPLKWPKDYLSAEAMIDYKLDRGSDLKSLVLRQFSVSLCLWVIGIIVAIFVLNYEAATGRNNQNQA